MLVLIYTENHHVDKLKQHTALTPTQRDEESKVTIVKDTFLAPSYKRTITNVMAINHN